MNRLLALFIISVALANAQCVTHIGAPVCSAGPAQVAMAAAAGVAH
jgi:hypothetical protein